MRTTVTGVGAGGAKVLAPECHVRPNTGLLASSVHARTTENLDNRAPLNEVAPSPNGPIDRFSGVSPELGPPGPYPGRWRVP